MVENALVKLNIQLPEQGNIKDEVEHIKQEFIYSNVAREIAIYRMWRIHKTQLWRTIEDETGKQYYKTWDDFIEEMMEALGISRPLVYQRLRVYYVLEFLQYSVDESVKKLISKPNAIAKALSKLVHWDMVNSRPLKITVPRQNNLTQEEAIVAIREIIDKFDAFDFAKDANKFMNENEFGEPVFTWWRDGLNLVLHYTYYAVDQQGNFVVDNEGEITFMPNANYSHDIGAFIDQRLRR